MGSVLLLVNVALVATAGVVTAQRPTFDEWKNEQGNMTAHADAESARQAKMAAVAKVTDMLEDVQKKVMMEGEVEAKTYNEFACFCKDTIKEKSDAISVGSEAKSELEADINVLAGKRDDLDSTIRQLGKDIEKENDEVEKAKKVRASELALYNSEAADLAAGIMALDGALKVLKDSKGGKPAAETSLVQLQEVGKTVRTAALIADSLGLIKDSDSSVLGAFLQQAPEVEFENYKFHSSDIIGTLEQLRKDFKLMQDGVDAAEVEAKKTHTRFLQDKANIIKALELDVKQAQAEKEETISAIKTKNEELTTTAAELLDDKQYLESLAQMCKEKKITWDERSRVRADELYTLTQVIGIIKGAVTNQTSASTVRFSQLGVTLRRAELVATDTNAMDQLEADAEAAEPAAAFVQMAQVHSHSPGNSEAGRQYVADMLKRSGEKLKSEALTSLARTIFEVDGADPFAKVKQLIQELIERLLQQASNEANQKGWCDKATSAAKQKRTYATEEIRDVNAEMAELEALRDKLTLEIDALENEIEELIDSRKAAEKIREEEKADSAASIEEAQAGLDAVNMAIGVMDKFYTSLRRDRCDIERVYIYTELFPGEVHWSIIDDGKFVCGGEGYAGADTKGAWHNTTCCLNSGTVYTLGCEDKYGDGWNGGYLRIGDEDYCTGKNLGLNNDNNKTWEFKPFEFTVPKPTSVEGTPDAGFDNFETYTGSQGEAGGILGMMEVIASDFTRTISETQKAEALAEEEHLDFMTQTGKSLGEKKVIEKQKTTERDDAVEDLGDAGAKLDTETKILETSLQELIELKAACEDTIMSYDERVARREEEIEALKKALCILNAYAEYGPDGLADAC